MSLYKFTSSRFCKSVAGFLFGVMILSACQETAQVVVSNAQIAEAIENGETNVPKTLDNALAICVKKGEMTPEEATLAKKFYNDPNARILLASANEITLRTHNAVKEGKGNAIIEALEKGSVEEFNSIIGLSNSEAEELSKTISSAQSNLLQNLGDSKDLFLQLGRKRSSECQECTITNAQKFVAKLTGSQPGSLIIQMPNFNGKDITSIQALGDKCIGKEWWKWGLFILASAACAAGSIAGCTALALGFPLAAPALIGTICSFGFVLCVTLFEELICQ